MWKWNRFITHTGPRRGNTPRRGPWQENLQEGGLTKQVGSWERGRACGRAPWGSCRVGKQKACGNFIGVFEWHEVTVKGGHERELATKTSLITRVHLATQTGPSQPVCGDVETSRKQEVFKIYNIMYLLQVDCQLLQSSYVSFLSGELEYAVKKQSRQWDTFHSNWDFDLTEVDLQIDSGLRLLFVLPCV